MCAARTCKCLAACHQELLRHWLLVLRKVCRAVPRSHTTPALAGHFVGPSMLWRPGAHFVEYPEDREHAALATVVRCLILFLDDVWNNGDEKARTAIFLARESAVAATPFAMRSASQFVDSLERESRRQAELRNMIEEPKARCGRSVHTWPGRRSSASVSKVATFPRCAHLDETGFPSLRDEEYLYPDWAFQPLATTSNPPCPDL
ncbi:hypothetical protein HPB52_021626 [Rhipicephalus sanguineus]|uniref:Uncharacterized protein n=1 Tax=Rhipicephalus sanguineus TaxID=34632 RepID=A0A9D4Q3Q4_RHISA|nr:hypothetical protein HPB52_021626 [Rhipicephalus sanguineus]